MNNRDFSESVEDGGDLAKAGDLGPEGLSFIPADGSPTGSPMLAVGNEVSGTTTLFSITGDAVRRHRRGPPTSRYWASTTSTAASRPTDPKPAQPSWAGRWRN